MCETSGMATPNFNPTPREKFQSHPSSLDKHNELLQLPAFELAVDTALAEYMRQLAERGEESPWSTHYRMAGAHEFIAVLKGLSRMPEPVKYLTPTNLNHRA